MSPDELIRLSMQLIAVLVIAGFIPATAFSFYQFRLPKKQEEYEEIVSRLGKNNGEGNSSTIYSPNIKNEYDPKDYVVPVSLATVVCILCAIVVVMGARFVETPEGMRISLILMGPAVAEGLEDPQTISQLNGMLIIAMAFMGGYIWTIQNLLRRLATIDLPPSTYYNIAIRIMMAVFVALLLYYFFRPGAKTVADALSADEIPRNMEYLTVLAFFAGMFPQRALQWLQEHLRLPWRHEEKGADPLPINMIQGAGVFQRLRLAEVGIDNSQNLASANLVELLLRTPFNPRQLIDWIAQAKLYIYFKSDVMKLRKYGIRTAFDLITVGTNGDRLEELATHTGMPLIHLQNVLEIMQSDSDIEMLQCANKHLSGF
ncbi:MAG: hypothetical protein SV201_14520 [Pseudomonadota bacterium]|nr:hypothetical protein [Pseudomonadota bacterium]